MTEKLLSNGFSKFSDHELHSQLTDDVWLCVWVDGNGVSHVYLDNIETDEQVALNVGSIDDVIRIKSVFMEVQA